jgi:uncharacterized protein
LPGGRPAGNSRAVGRPARPRQAGRVARGAKRSRVLEAIIVVGVVIAFNLPLPLLRRDLPGLLATAAVWAALLAGALLVRRPLAIHAALLGGLGAPLRAAMPRLWPALVPLLTAFGLYVLCLWRVRTLRAGATWLRRGSLAAPVRWLVLAVIPVAAVGLVAWAAVVGNAGLSEGTQQAIASLRGVSLWLLLPGAVLFACANAAAEELFYRGIFMEALVGTVAVVPALVLQAVSYGLQHTQGFPSGPLGVTLATVYGLVLGVIRLKANGLLAPWLAHVVADLTIIALIAWYAAAVAAPSTTPNRDLNSYVRRTSSLSGIFAGCVLAGRAGDIQLMGPARLTVAVRWGPGLTLRCGTRMARPVRPRPMASAKGGLVLLAMVGLIGRRDVEQARYDQALGHRPRSVRPG